MLGVSPVLLVLKAFIVMGYRRSGPATATLHQPQHGLQKYGSELHQLYDDGEPQLKSPKFGNGIISQSNHEATLLMTVAVIVSMIRHYVACLGCGSALIALCILFVCCEMTLSNDPFTMGLGLQSRGHDTEITDSPQIEHHYQPL